MNKPSSYGLGVSGVVGAENQTVATTKYSVGTAFDNRYGDRYAAINVSSTQPYTLYVLATPSEASSHADNGAPAGSRLLTTITGNPANATATSPAGLVHYVRIAGFRHILPMVHQTSGSPATVTIRYQTFND